MHSRMVGWVRLAAALALVCQAGAQEPENEEPWTLHVLGTDMGRAYILDRGSHEIIIDAGGDKQLGAYLQKSGLVEAPIELVVISNGDTGAWGGLRDLVTDFGNCGVAEIWEAGFVPPSRGGVSRRALEGFLERLEACPGLTMKRPLEKSHRPTALSGNVEPFKLPSLPGVTFTLLHSRAYLQGVRLPDSDLVNLASIVLKVEIGGNTLLFPGDAVGKHRDAAASAPPEYNEKVLLEIERKHPGTLKSDILAVPHAGSEASSTDAFIAAVAPQFAIFAGHSRFDLPRQTVVDRYAAENRNLLFTKLNPAVPHKAIVIHLDNRRRYEYEELETPEAGKPSVDDIPRAGRPPATAEAAELLRVGFRGADLSGANLRGRRMEGMDLTGTSLRGADLFGARLEGASLKGADLRDALLERTRLKDANLDGALLQRASMRDVDASGVSFENADLSRLRCRDCKFDGANLKGARLPYAWLSNTSFNGATMDGSTLTALRYAGFKVTGASMAGAKLDRNRWDGAVFVDTDLTNADLTETSLRGARFVGGKLQNVTLHGANLRNAMLQVEPGGAPSIRWALEDWLPTLTYESSPHTLAELRKNFKDAGLREQERILTYVIEKKQQEKAPAVERWFRYVAFDLTTRYGRDPARPLRILALLWLVATLVYYIIIRRKGRARLMVLVARRKKNNGAEFRTRAVPILSLLQRRHGVRQRLAREARILGTAAQFSAANAVNFKVQWLDAGTWLRMMRRRTLDYEPTAWLRTVAAAQSLMSMYLLAIWLLTYFGRPFE